MSITLSRFGLFRLRFSDLDFWMLLLVSPQVRPTKLSAAWTPAAEPSRAVAMKRVLSAFMVFLRSARVVSFTACRVRTGY